MPKKSRRPFDFGYKDYLDWTKWLKNWLDEHSGDSDYPSHLIAAYNAAVDAYEAALIDYDAKTEAQIGKSELYDIKAKAVYEKLLTIKIALPTVMDDPDVLAAFGLSLPLSRDREDIYVRVQVVLEHWDEVSGEPVYDPLEGDFDALIVLNTEFTSAHDVYYAAFDAMQQAQNTLVAAKEALHDSERKIFTWYRSRYTKGTEEFWTGTPWGAVGGGEPSVEYPVFPDPPETFTAEDKGGGMTEVVYSYVDGATHGLLERRKAGTNQPWEVVNDHLPMDPENMLPYRELHVPPGEWEYRFTAMNGEEAGTPVVITVVVGP